MLYTYMLNDGGINAGDGVLLLAWQLDKITVLSGFRNTKSYFGI